MLREHAALFSFVLDPITPAKNTFHYSALVDLIFIEFLNFRSLSFHQIHHSLLIWHSAVKCAGGSFSSSTENVFAALHFGVAPKIVIFVRFAVVPDRDLDMGHLLHNVADSDERQNHDRARV